jgi:photosystem I P700 chlorophyll a apoprotein A2
MGQNPLSIRPIAHAIWDPLRPKLTRWCLTRKHYGYISGGILLVCAQTKIYTLVQSFLGQQRSFAGWLHLQPKFQPGLSWFKT